MQTVKRNQQQYDMPLKILSYDELYGWTMDAIVEQIGKKNNCTFCGVFRRQALDRGAASLNVDHIVTGHNADDIAETVLMNSGAHLMSKAMHWQFYSNAWRYCSTWTVYFNLYPGRGYNQTIQALQVRLWEGNCHVSTVTWVVLFWLTWFCRYAYFKKLDYFSTECIYSPDAYRGHARTFLKDLEAARPSAIIDIIHSGEAFEVKEEIKAAQKAQRQWCHFHIVMILICPQKHAKDVGTCLVMIFARHVRCWRVWREAWRALS